MAVELVLRVFQTAETSIFKHINLIYESSFGQYKTEYTKNKDK